MIPTIILIALLLLAVVLAVLPYRKCSCSTREKANDIFQKKETYDKS